MNYVGNDRHPNDGRGRSEGSRKNQFSKENQPKRRRGPRSRSRSPMDLVDHLNRPITISVDGVRKEMTVHQVLLQTISQNILKAPVKEQLRMLERLDKLGVTAVQHAEARLAQERFEFEQEQREFQELLETTRLLSDIAEREAAEATAKWFGVAKVLKEISKHCTCGACNTFENEDVAWALDQFEIDKQDALEIEVLLEELRREAREDPRESWDCDSSQEIMVGRDGKRPTPSIRNARSRSNASREG